MPVVVKFIVANEANAYIVSQLTTEYFAKVSPDHDYREHTVSAFLNSSASFTREWLMSFDVTGEDENKVEKALVFLELVSSNMPEEIKGDKPLYIEKVALSHDNEGLSDVLNRAFAVAEQRKHDALWVKIPTDDTMVLTFLNNAGFEKTGEISGSFLLKKEI